MLGLLAHKWKWKKRREAEGAACDKPNIIFGADAHIAGTNLPNTSTLSRG